MKKIIFIILAFFLTSCGSSGGSGYNPVTPLYSPLFILSGQSNMQLLPLDYFLPTINEYFSYPDHAIAVKDAHGGQAITQWYDEDDLEGDGEVVGPLYDQLMGTVSAAIEGKNIKSVFFIWMQGESDGWNENPAYSENYKENLLGLIELIESDLQTNVYFVIGRINEYLMGVPEWDAIREIQVEVAEGDPNGTWEITDDLGSTDGGIHYSPEGYELLGERFARAAISLISN